MAPISINGSGSITGISAGGLPDASIVTADIADGAITDAKVNASAAIADSKLSGTTCKAWCNFNGTTASPSTIRASYNVSSVTKTGTGLYTVNLTNAMPDANYTIVACAGWAALVNILSNFTTSTIPVVTGYFSNTAGSASGADNAQVYISIFR